MTQTLSWMFLMVIWNKQTMFDTSSLSLRGEDVIWLVHLVTGEPLSKGTTYDLCRHKRMLQWSTYKKEVTFMNKTSRFRGLTCKQAILPHGIFTWNMLAERPLWFSVEQPASVSSEIKFRH